MIKLLIALLVLLCAAFVLATMGRRKHPGLAALRGWNYAHRGLHDQTRPENSMAAFAAAVEHGYGIELDVHLLKDGGLAVIHDSPLVRTTGAEGAVEQLDTSMLQNYRLEGTDQTIPTLAQVLELVDGKTPLIVELKAVGSNHAALTEAVCRQLESYKGLYCLESFDPRCIRWLKQHRPQLIRGQLASNYLKRKVNQPWPLRFIITFVLTNFMTRPDFVAYNFADRKCLGPVLARKLWGLQGVAWTLRSPQEHAQAVEEGWLPIFENYTP